MCATDYYKPSCFSKTQASDPKYRIVSYLESAEKIKQLAVENHAYTDHENNIQLVSESTTGAKFSCVTVS